jgi:hypothetical protein
MTNIHTGNNTDANTQIVCPEPWTLPKRSTARKLGA